MTVVNFLKAGVVSTVLGMCAVMTTACDNKAVNNDGTNVLTDKFDKVTKLTGKTFGTYYYVTVPGGYPGGEDTLRSDAEFVFKKVSDAISTFDPNSELARFNALQSTEPFVISNYLAQIIEESQRQGLRIDGAMDITVQPLVNLWGFGPHGDIVTSPSEEEIQEAKKLVGYDKFNLRYANGVAYLEKVDPKVSLDLSTIGEGLAADELARLMDDKGVANYMIAIAGAIRSKGANPDGMLWSVGIEDPTQQKGVFARACPQDRAISTAGSYRNFFIDEKTGQFFSHIIDPRTGRPVENRTVSVTVIDRLATITDALDTGLLVLGAEKAVEWGNRNDVAVYAIEVDENKKMKASYSKSFEPYLKCVVKPGFTPAVTQNINEENTASSSPDKIE